MSLRTNTCEKTITQDKDGNRVYTRADDVYSTSERGIVRIMAGGGILLSLTPAVVEDLLLFLEQHAEDSRFCQEIKEMLYRVQMAPSQHHLTNTLWYFPIYTEWQGNDARKIAREFSEEYGVCWYVEGI